MSKRTLVAIIVLVIIGGVIVWLNRNKIVVNETVNPVLSVSGLNLTKNLDAVLKPAQAQDIIVYTLTAENPTDKVMPGFMIEVNISQVTDKSTLVDAQGASYNSATNSLVWTPLDIPANGSIQKQFSVKVNPVPADSTNMVMKIEYNNQINIGLAKSAVAGAMITPPARVGHTSTPKPYKAPTTGPEGELGLWFAAASTAIFAGIKKYRLNKLV